MRRLLIVLLVTALCIASCAPAFEDASASALLLDTYCVVTVYAQERDEAQRLAGAALVAVGETELIFSKTNPSSELYKLNEAGGGEVSEALLYVLMLALEYAELSGGLFDPTVGALTGLWDFKSDNPAPPDSTAIAAALERVGYTRVTIDGSYVDLGGTTLDLGGIAKGFAADVAAQTLRDAGVTSAIINLGGDVLAVGEKPDGSAWSVGVRDPHGGEEYADVLSVRDIAVATSGTYERGFDYEGMRYHHILDPFTGYPSQSGILSATVTADTAVRADALASICLLLGEDAARSLIDTLDGVEIRVLTAP